MAARVSAAPNVKRDFLFLIAPLRIEVPDLLAWGAPCSIGEARRSCRTPARTPRDSLSVSEPTLEQLSDILHMPVAEGRAWASPMDNARLSAIERVGIEGHASSREATRAPERFGRLGHQPRPRPRSPIAAPEQVSRRCPARIPKPAGGARQPDLMRRSGVLTTDCLSAVDPNQSRFSNSLQKPRTSGGKTHE
jgi:hypothetical protein